MAIHRGDINEEMILRNTIKEEDNIQEVMSVDNVKDQILQPRHILDERITDMISLQNNILTLDTLLIVIMRIETLEDEFRTIDIIMVIRTVLKEDILQ